MIEPFDHLSEQMAANKSPKEAWEVYLKAFVPREASEAQRRDLKGAFYGGMGALLLALANVGREGGPVVVEEVKRFLRGEEE